MDKNMEKVVLVTGASSRLGREITLTLHKKGHTVYAGARNKRSIEKRKRIIPVTLDVSSSKDCKKVVERIRKEKGHLDVLINNAGITLTGETLSFSPKDFQEILSVNTVGAFRVMKCSLPLMRKGSKIINISSMNGHLALPFYGVYSSSKFALEALSRSLFYELKNKKIDVVSLAPGAIDFGSKVETTVKHKPARERFWLVGLLFPMIKAEKVSKKILRLIEKKRIRRARMPLGIDSKLTNFILRKLPFGFWNLVVFSLWRKK